MELIDLIPSFLAGLGIFALRVIDISLAVTRLMMVLHGRKLWAWILGFSQALLFISVVRVVLLNLGDWFKVIGYSSGFATGLIVGMLIESRLAMGYSRLRIISARLGSKIVENLREQGYGSTEIPAQGRDGMVTVIDCNVPRRLTDEVVKQVEKSDPDAFITVESVRVIQRGYWQS